MVQTKQPLPLPPAESVEQKFRRLASTTLPRPAVEELIGVVSTLEHEATLQRLTSLIAYRAG